MKTLLALNALACCVVLLVAMSALTRATNAETSCAAARSELDELRLEHYRLLTMLREHGFAVGGP